MDEGRRFIRYVFPGLSSLLFFAVFCAISDWSRVKSWFNSVTDDAAESIGVALAIFVASGAIGYLISVAHHFVYWVLYARVLNCLFADQRQVIKDAWERGDLKFVERSTGVVLDGSVVHAISKRGAWILTNSIWHLQLRGNNNFAASEHRSTTLFDIMHGAGALFIGGILAGVAWLIVECTSGWSCSSWLVLVLATLLCFLLAYNLNVTIGLCLTVSDTMLSNFLASRDADNGGKPLQVVVERSLFM